MALQIDFPSFVLVVNVVVSPLPFPLLCLEGHWEGASHLYSFADRQIRGGFMIEEPLNFVLKVNGSTGKLNAVELIILTHADCFNEFHEREGNILYVGF